MQVGHEKMLDSQFQTPKKVCQYMASLIPDNKKVHTILEPTKGQGNIVKELMTKCKHIIAPDNFFDINKNQRFDYIVMNPPFTPMKIGYDILFKCMEMSDNIIALMPWLVLINGTKRTDHLFNYGLKSVTHLPRNIFKNTRVQCCILELKKGYKGKTELKKYEIPTK